MFFYNAKKNLLFRSPFCEALKPLDSLWNSSDGHREAWQWVKFVKLYPCVQKSQRQSQFFLTGHRSQTLSIKGYLISGFISLSTLDIPSWIIFWGGGGGLFSVCFRTCSSTPDLPQLHTHDSPSSPQATTMKNASRYWEMSWETPGCDPLVCFHSVKTEHLRFPV